MIVTLGIIQLASFLFVSYFNIRHVRPEVTCDSEEHGNPADTWKPSHTTFNAEILSQRFVY
jgi:hypothetical protein